MRRPTGQTTVLGALIGLTCPSFLCHENRAPAPHPFSLSALLTAPHPVSMVKGSLTSWSSSPQDRPHFNNRNHSCSLGSPRPPLNSRDHEKDSELTERCHAVTPTVTGHYSGRVPIMISQRKRCTAQSLGEFHHRPPSCPPPVR